MRKLEFEESLGFFKAKNAICRFRRCIGQLANGLLPMLDIKPHPLLTLVVLTLFCSFMGWPYAWVLLQIPNPFRTIAIFGTIITFVVGAVAVNPERRC